MTLSKDTTESTGRPTLPKCPISHSPADMSGTYTYHLGQHVMFLQQELRNKDDYNKNLLKKLSRQSDIIYSFREQNL